MNVLKATEILLPVTDDMTAWSVIACDQFTSEIGYWTELSKALEGKKTTLDLILPEIYLNDGADNRIEKINGNIDGYLKDGTFRSTEKGFILTVRKTPYRERRIGLVCAVDLEEYRYSQKSDALIRSTEATIEERIPPRLKIRKNAKIEIPHIMLLCDDEKREITEKLYEKRASFEKLYDFELNMGGGAIEGYFIKDTESVIKGFEKLLESDRLISKYGKDDKFLFAVGDGNHSLATAKTHWNNLKLNLSEKEREEHPARFALVEIVNIYDEGIYFEPIYRFIRNVDVENFAKGIKKLDLGTASLYYNRQTYEFNGEANLPTGIKTADSFINEYVNAHGGTVDYVHGEKNVKSLVDGNPDSVAVLFQKMNKSELFGFVSKYGSLPKKTFSMGEGVEKRYYLESKKIVR